MSNVLTTGTIFAIGALSGVNFTLAAVSNANPAVAQLSAAHGIAPNELMALKSGWSRLNDRIVRAAAVATNDVTLEGINSLNTSVFLPGSGVGTGQEVTAGAWVEITQVLEDWAPSGGDINWGQLQYAATDIGVRYPRSRNPVTMSLPFAFDASLPWLPTVRLASELRTPVPFRIRYPSGALAYAMAYFNLRDSPQPQDGALVDQLDLSLLTQPTLYAS